MKTLEELNTIENQFIKNCGGYWNVTEFDHKQNTISRNKIRTLKNQYGKCFLGNINYYDEQRKNIDNEPILKEYKKGMIYNFSCAFAVPVHSPELVELIRNYNKSHDPFNGKLIMQEIEEIFNKVEELNGINVRWV
jgi:predicted MPP superfamily phosphohydrolase